MEDQAEDYRERQRKKWEQSASQGSIQNAEPSSSSTAAPAPPASSSVAPAAPAPPASSSVAPAAPASPPASSSAPGKGSAPVVLSRLHILPLMNSDGEKGEAGDLNVLAPTLRKLRADGTIVVTGNVVTADGWEYIVVGVEPSEGGAIGQQTEFFLDGEPVQRFEKVQFLALSELSSAKLFEDYVRPKFASTTEVEVPVDGLCKRNVFQTNQTFEIVDHTDSSSEKITFCIAATHPPGFGIIDKQSLIFVEADSTPEFERIHLVPFHDTLPRAYEYDIFNDYVKPFLKGSPLMKFRAQDHFTYQGVQFKVVCCDPDGPRRVGKSTTIYCEGVLHPSLRNLLPPELLVQLSYLPPGLQMLLLNTDAIGSGDVYERLMNVQERLAARQGMANETIAQIENYKWREDLSENAQQQCMVCLSDFKVDEDVRKLPCAHLFHCSCIDEWLRRCTDCPICKMNIDRRVRNY